MHGCTPTARQLFCASLVALLCAGSPPGEARANKRSKKPADPLAVAGGVVARALASVAPAFDQKLQPAQDLAAQGKPDEALKTLASLSANEANPENKVLAELAAGGVAERAGRPTEALAHYQAAAKLGGRLKDYARFFEGLMLQGSERRAEAHAAFSAALNGDDLPPATQLEIRSRLGNLAAVDKNWKLVSATFKPLMRKLRGSELYPGALYQMYRAERRSPSGCAYARELYAKYPSFGETAAWGPDLHSNKIDGQSTGCSATGRDLQDRVRRLQWSGESERAYKELQSVRARGLPDHGSEHISNTAEAVGTADASSTQADADDEDVADYSADSMMANHLVNEGRVDEALKLLLSHYQEQRSRPPFLLLLAKAASRAGEYPTAVGAYYRVYELRPKTKEGKNALFQAAFMSYQFQDYDGASRKFELFSKEFGDSSLAKDARWHLAWIHYLRGDYEGALQGFERLEKMKSVVMRKRSRRNKRMVAIAPPPDAYGGDRIQYWKAMCLLRLNRTTDAIPTFQKIARDPAYGYYAIAAYYRVAALPGLQSPVKAELAAMKKGASGKFTEEELRQAEEKQRQEAAVEAVAASEAASPEGEITPPQEAVAAEVPSTESESVAQSTVPGSAGEAAIVRRFDRARSLAAAGFPEHARRELAEIERRAHSNEDRRALMSEYRALGNWNRSSAMGELAFGAQRLRGGMQKERGLWEYAYPRAFGPAVESAAKQSSIPEELVWGIMRAESLYRQDAYSAVGAMGLMQLMPFTGKKVADLLGAGAQFQPRSLLDPLNNIRLGVRYLQRLHDAFKGSVPLIAAGYNAGPHRVQAWLKSFGPLEMDEFIEHIPYMETRNYVKKVVRNYQIYGLLYANSGRNLKWLAKPVGVTFDAPIPTREMW